MVTIRSNDISADYSVLLNELQMYNPELMDKPRIEAIIKSGYRGGRILDIDSSRNTCGYPIYFISSVSGYGIEQLKDGL